MLRQEQRTPEKQTRAKRVGRSDSAETLWTGVLERDVGKPVSGGVSFLMYRFRPLARELRSTISTIIVGV